jgi:hypothetical protein
MCVRLGMQDIVHYSWLQDSARTGRLLPLSKRYVIAGTAATMAALARETDVFMDSFTAPADEESLRASLAECVDALPHPFGGAPRATGNNTSTANTRAFIQQLLTTSTPAPGLLLAAPPAALARDRLLLTGH